MSSLLSREMFRVKVLSRNQGQCCIPGCGLTAVDAHHILNRNLFVEPDEFGGYFFANGAQLCSGHHYDAELTLITVEQLREWCDIQVPVVPSVLDAGKLYDCWGNEIVADGFRVKGLLFEDSGCQKALGKAKMLWRFIS